MSRDRRPGRVGSRVAYAGRILDVHLDRVRFPDGSEGELEIVRHPGAAAVLPLWKAGEHPERPEATVTLLRQYRYAAGGDIWEIPAGTLEEGESPAACARRELEEEAGLRAGRLSRLTRLHTSPGFTDETIHLFLASELTRGEMAPEAGEFLEVRELPLREALAMVRDGRITDSKTACTLLYAIALAGAGAEGAAPEPPPV